MAPKICEWIIKLDGKMDTTILELNRFTSVGAKMILEALSQLKFPIKALDFSRNRLGDEFLIALGEFIQSNPSVEHIDIADTNVTDQGIEVFAPALFGNRSIQEIGLFRNDGITKKSIKLIMELIENTNIVSLRTWGNSELKCIELVLPFVNNILRTGWKYMQLSEWFVLIVIFCSIVFVLGQYSQMVIFKYIYSKITDDEIVKICDAMKKYGVDNLTSISFERNMLTSKGATILFRTLLECNSRVQSISMVANKLDDTSIPSICDYIQYNQHLCELYLGNGYFRDDGNGFTDAGVELLLSSIMCDCKIERIGLDGNQGITANSIPWFIEAAKKSYLKSINLYGTSLLTRDVHNINSALALPFDERELTIQSNTKSAAKIKLHD